MFPFSLSSSSFQHTMPLYLPGTGGHSPTSWHHFLTPSSPSPLCCSFSSFSSLSLHCLACRCLVAGLTLTPQKTNLVTTLITLYRPCWQYFRYFRVTFSDCQCLLCSLSLCLSAHLLFHVPIFLFYWFLCCFYFSFLFSVLHSSSILWLWLLCWCIFFISDKSVLYIPLLYCFAWFFFY